MGNWQSVTHLGSVTIPEYYPTCLPSSRTFDWHFPPGYFAPFTTTKMSREPLTHCGVRDSSLLADCQLGELLLWGFVLVGFPQVKSKVQISNRPQLLLETFPSTGLLPWCNPPAVFTTFDLVGGLSFALPL